MRSIQNIIFLRFFFITVSFFAIVSVGMFFVADRMIMGFVISDNTNSLSFVVNNIKSNYLQQLKVLDQLASTDAFVKFSPAKAKAVIDQFLKFDNIYSTVHVYLKNGDLVFALKRDNLEPYKVEPNFFQRRNLNFVQLAQRVMAKKKSEASETYITKKGEIYQTYIVPFLDPSGEVAGIISGGVFPGLHHIDHLVDGLRLSAANFIVISDNKGNILARNGFHKQPDDLLLENYLQNESEHFFGRNNTEVTLTETPMTLGGYPYLLLSSQIPQMKLLVTLGVGTMAIKEKKEELLRYILVALSLGLILSLVASHFVGRDLSRPLAQVINALRRINIGDFSRDVASADRKDELGHLGKLVNSLNRKMRKDRFLGDLWSNEKEVEKLLKGRKNSQH